MNKIEPLCCTKQCKTLWKKKQLDLNTNYVRTTELDLCIEVAVVIPVVKKVALRWVTTSCVKGIFTVTIGWD